jgi:simple sugar transport system ATP-binding protein
VEDLPVGERQRLEILKALYRGARILILDEPTAVLTPQETEQLFATLRQLRARGTTILLITHKLKEIIALTDNVTVMRAGRVVLDCATAGTSTDALAQAMVGRRVQLGRGDAAQKRAAGAPLLQASHLGWRDSLGVARLADVSLTLHAGEIVGIAGVSGNGQSELLDALSGLLVPDSGTLQLGGRTFTPTHWLDPAAARDLALAHVPEDRHLRGLVLPFAAWESGVLGYHTLPRYGRRGWMQQATMLADTAQMMERYDVRPRDPRVKSAQFSGGNQQKLVLAREAMPEPKVLLVGQPTRGVDIGAIEFIHGRLRAMRDAGGAVLVVSSELDEIFALADRVLVMTSGRITGEMPIEQCTEAGVGCLMGDAAPSGIGPAMPAAAAS